MALAEIDRRLLERCLAGTPNAWEDFVDRYLGLVVHVVSHTARSRSLKLSQPDRDDLIAEVFLVILDNDYAVLRRFQGRSSLATYLTVVARRVVVRKLLGSLSGLSSSTHEAYVPADPSTPIEKRIEDVDEVEQLLTRLDGPEASVVRMYHLEGKSYREISTATGMPENSIGPALSRARTKLRNGVAQPPSPAGPDVAPTADQPAH
ncbi:MAG: sigma-70 family RNA polymerase sigma factor [Planctomycetota bacterium]